MIFKLGYESDRLLEKMWWLFHLLVGDYGPCAFDGAGTRSAKRVPRFARCNRIVFGQHLLYRRVISDVPNAGVRVTEIRHIVPWLGYLVNVKPGQSIRHSSGTLTLCNLIFLRV